MGGEPRQQINGVTAFIDGSQIYGSDDETSLGLRDGAKLKTHSRTSKFGKGHLPMRSQCGFPAGNPNPTAKDLTAGDTRAIVQPGLASIHTLFLNEHNRIARNLTQLAKNSSNPIITDMTRVERNNFVFEVDICFTNKKGSQISKHFLNVILMMSRSLLDKFSAFIKQLCAACPKASWSRVAADRLPRIPSQHSRPTGHRRLDEQ